MRNKKLKPAVLVFILAAIVLFWLVRLNGTRGNGEVIQEVRPVSGSIEERISTTGTVLPRNRLEVKPPVNGRIEEILVSEGQKVKAGQILVWMSSSERAALLDAARGQGEEALSYWKETYKAISLISPIDGEVIVATTQSGQTVTTSDAAIVLSDRLIVRAQVDETDIGKVKLGQNAVITIDAYPDTKIKATVAHIYYESKIVNNVTIYDVDLLPETVPSFFRSGMNASIDFVVQGKENAFLVPVEAVIKEKDEVYVLLKGKNGRSQEKRKVEVGSSDDKNIEILSGIEESDTLIVKSKRYTLPTASTEKNPFLPARGRGGAPSRPSR